MTATEPAEAIDARLAEIRAGLEACAAEGFDPAHVTIITYDLGYLGLFPSADTETPKALAVLARLTDEEPTRHDQETATVYRVGDLVVYAELHPDEVARRAALLDEGQGDVPPNAGSAS